VWVGSASLALSSSSPEMWVARRERISFIRRLWWPTAGEERGKRKEEKERGRDSSVRRERKR
jgi:hypothetical protein